MGSVIAISSNTQFEQNEGKWQEYARLLQNYTFIPRSEETQTF